MNRQTAFRTGSVVAAFAFALSVPAASTVLAQGAPTPEYGFSQTPTAPVPSTEALTAKVAPRLQATPVQVPDLPVLYKVATVDSWPA